MNKVEKSLLVNASSAVCFKAWTSSEYLPTFIDKVEQTVMQDGQFLWRWHMRDASGKSVTWDTVVTDVEPNRMLSWRSVPGSAIDLEGCVQFNEEAANRTRVNLSLWMEIPEQTTQMFAGEFFENPLHLAEDILEKFKALVEQRLFIPQEAPVASGTGAGTETEKVSDIPLSIEVEGHMHEIRDEPPM